MGNLFSYSESSYKRGNLKLESQKIVEFSGRMEDWQKWKNRTECALDGSGYEEILTDESYALSHPRESRIVYAQLSVATIGGTANHLIKKFDSTKNGYSAWEALCNWYDGEMIQNETSDALRDKLESLKLTTTTSASVYINNYLTWYRDLEKIPGEGMSKSHAVSLFLRNITDPDYDTTVKILKNGRPSLEEAVNSIRKFERDLVHKRAEHRRLKIDFDVELEMRLMIVTIILLQNEFDGPSRKLKNTGISGKSLHWTMDSLVFRQKFGETNLEQRKRISSWLGILRSSTTNPLRRSGSPRR